MAFLSVVFTMFGVFGVAFAIWLTGLIALFVLDAIWTHGLATTYLNASSTILTQVWSFIRFFFDILGRVFSAAPRALQVVVFFIIGFLSLGLIVNWVLAANVVCSHGVPYQGNSSGSIVKVFIAKTLESQPMNATSGSSEFTAGGGNGGGGGGGGAG